MFKEMNFICDVCKENSNSTDFPSKQYCRVSSLEASFICSKCSKCFSMAYEVTDKELSPHVGTAQSLSVEYELADQESPPEEEGSSFGTACDETSKELQPSASIEDSSISRPSGTFDCDDDSESSPEPRKLFEKDSNDKPFKCGICHNRFKYKQRLQNHMNIHKGSFKCNVCNKYCESKHQLKIHLIKHSNKKDHKCSVCPKSYKFKDSLKSHMNKHNTNNPFSCKLCKASCTTKRDLIIHMNKHSKERNHTCDVCSKSFKYISCLTRHMNIHDEDNPIRCVICNKNCESKSYLEVHMTRHSND